MATRVGAPTAFLQIKVADCGNRTRGVATLAQPTPEEGSVAGLSEARLPVDGSGRGFSFLTRAYFVQVPSHFPEYFEFISCSPIFIFIQPVYVSPA